MPRSTIAAAIAVCVFVSTPAPAKECSAQSGERRAALLELYTSEGCSSCPPADEWVNDLDKRGFSAQRVVPLAFHVDYWDYIGWKDRFAQSQFTERQRAASRHNGLGTIYTPQMQLNGVTMRRWGDNPKLSQALDLIARDKPAADLSLAVQVAGDALSIKAVAQVADAAQRAASRMFVAVYENNLTSDVRAGENSGAQLSHNYVVRAWFGPVALSDAGAARFAQTVILPREWKRADLGVAALVENGGSGAILQALACE